MVEEWLGEDGLNLNRVEISGTDVDVRLSGEGEVPSVEILETRLERRLGIDVVVRVEYFPSELIISNRN